MGLFDKLSKYMSEGEEVIKNLNEEYEHKSDYELFSHLGRILQSDISDINRNGSESDEINDSAIALNEKVEFAAIKSILLERGYAEYEIMTKAIESY